jgi:seryl-tRNA synthetase
MDTNMTWIAVFIVVAAVAIVMQAFVMLGMYLQIKQTCEQVKKMGEELQAKINPVITKVSNILEDSEERISSLMADAADVTRMARMQASKVDRIMTDTLERLRVQIIRADQILTGALEVVEDAGSKVRKTIAGPVIQASAVLHGLKVGIDFLRGRVGDKAGVGTDDELFI